MMIKDMHLPGCMVPDGAPPCDGYAELYELAIEMESAIHAISPWLSASLSDEGEYIRDIAHAEHIAAYADHCKEYVDACNAILALDNLITNPGQRWISL